MVPADINSGLDDDVDFDENPDLCEEAASSGSAELKVDVNADDSIIQEPIKQ